MSFSPISHQRGFSTLMALGTISVLLILVTGLATTYMRELRLSRATYDEILSSAGAEGMFEYAMLKVRNHRDGFADSVVTSSDTDANIITPSTDRSKNLKSGYTIIANSTGSEFAVEPESHLIIPLFSAPGTAFPTGTSKGPFEDATTKKTQIMEISQIDTLSWTLIGSKDGQSIGLSGTGNITPETSGIVRENRSQCYDEEGTLLGSCTSGQNVGETLEYFVDTPTKVGDFLSSVENPYFMLYNNTGDMKTITIKSDPSTPFTLPTLTVIAQAQKNDSLQTFRFVEDKSRYYDALKYGIYNDGN